jgi:aquaporin Z
MGLGISSDIYSQTTSSLKWGAVWLAFEFVAALIAASLYKMMQDDKSLLIKCVSEFLGVFVLVFTVGMNVVTNSPATALSAAGALVSMIYSLGYISGAHLNPAVTLSVVLSGRDKCSVLTGVCYVMSQCLAAIIAGHIYAGFHRVGPNSNVLYPLEPVKGYSFFSAGVGELFFTAVLAYTVLAVATSSTAKETFQQTNQIFYFGLAIAACVIAGGFAIGGISGGELNPAVSLGISFGNLGHAASKTHRSPAINFVPFSLWELGGGIIASIIFRVTHSNEYSDLDLFKA